MFFVGSGTTFCGRSRAAFYRECSVSRHGLQQIQKHCIHIIPQDCCLHYFEMKISCRREPRFLFYFGLFFFFLLFFFKKGTELLACCRTKDQLGKRFMPSFQHQQCYIKNQEINKYHNSPAGISFSTSYMCHTQMQSWKASPARLSLHNKPERLSSGPNDFNNYTYHLYSTFPAKFPNDS